ncbi:hypothetical protein BKA62DRAFT_714908 [Auriculariales sp. MPI-PUGE-AT-0066]|nr:hypothetical protein BKA62DRAFT_714908 [Auriculariales sp. MPI-PUGE-AT-0066]
MPLYRVYHPKDILDDPTKASLAAEITEHHSSITGADKTNVTVLFIPFSASDALWAGTPAPPFVRVVAVIRAGLPGQLLASLYTIFGHALKGDALAQITLVEHRPEVYDFHQRRIYR